MGATPRLSYLNPGPAGGPAALHSRLVERPRFEEGPFGLHAARLVMGQGGGAVSDHRVGPHGHLVHRPRRQVGGYKGRRVRVKKLREKAAISVRTVPLRNLSTTVKFLLSLTCVSNCQDRITTYCLTLRGTDENLGHHPADGSSGRVKAARIPRTGS